MGGLISPWSQVLQISIHLYMCVCVCVCVCVLIHDDDMYHPVWVIQAPAWEGESCRGL